MAVKVSYSQSFIELMKSLSTQELKIIGDFITMLKASGFTSLPGRNKPSTGVSENHARRLQLIQYAIENNLWHYHVGHKVYDQKKPFGDWTSSHVVHYQNENSQSARFVHYDSHPPMKLPAANTLK
ncbi:hypothetical protein [Rahnella sp. ChDrAdgB13]|uniref:hypothetical protein n=1 Tax=Rahnella sp. ChDrAdgB13 TaxID=1850581 RepID=UPI001AD853A3|nr:hypothetical protein [Rahnella sp. ChDrAdgB13]